MKVLLLGGYGLIGKEIGRALLESSFEVIAVARDARLGARLLPGAEWHALDLNNPVKSEDWAQLLKGCDAVVNAAGALQSGGGDRLASSQRDNLLTLIAACDDQGVTRFVQISAPGAKPSAKTEFLRTKGEADAALQASQLDWVVLKPGLVIAPTAYGGSALLRMLAAIPWVQPLVLAKARFQCVAVEAVAEAVLACLKNPKLAQQSYDLMEEKAHRLSDLVRRLRGWLGFSPARLEISVPLWLGLLMAKAADLAAHLGWRSPLRSTALRVMADDVVGDPAPWQAASGQRMKSLDEILQDLPSTRQERVFARHLLVFPLALMGLSAFWLASGLIALISLEEAQALLATTLPTAAALALVLFGAVLDILIGLLLLLRRWFRRACVLSIAVSLTYLLTASFWLPALWLDPLGPLVKVGPTLLLALYLSLTAEER